ncbi:hypothetical protein M8J76_006682 [Diaphorina citri]|nr:hypothetical protein M8J75_013122 [Diaphorina citri]KAI5744924.1 hypothetical protein M8J76_006682 [Diaphorina citri]
MCHKFILSVFLLTLLASVTQASCPLGCSCKWKAGKRTVECIDRNFYTIPEGIDLDTQVLDLSSNNINVLQKEIFLQMGITNIQKLYLRKCKLEFVDDRAFRGVTNMDELDLSDNLLSTVPSLIYIPYLKSINLAHNPIHQISSYSFQSTPGIRYIDMSNCQIHTIYSEAFYGIDKIDTLKLNGNKLASLKPRTVDKLPYIRNLDIYDNPWLCDCKLREVKQFIDKYNIQFSFDPICISGPKKNIGQTFLELSINDFACVPEVELANNNEPVKEKVMVLPGSNLTLDCRVQSATPCRIMWSINRKIYDHVNWNSNKINIKEETVLSKDNSYLSVFSGGVDLAAASSPGGENIYDQKSTLTVFDTELHTDDGNYVCIVENNAGRTERAIIVEFSDAGFAAGSFQMRSLIIALFIIVLMIAFGILVIKLVNKNISNSIVKNSTSSVGSVTKNNSLSDTNYDNNTELPARPPLPKDLDLHNAHVVQCASDLDLVSAARYNEWQQYSTPEHFNRSKSSSGFYDPHDMLPIINLSSQASSSIQDFPPDFGLPVVNDYDKIPSAKTLRVWQRGVPVLPQYTPGKRSIISFKNNQATDV